MNGVHLNPMSVSLETFEYVCRFDRAYDELLQLDPELAEDYVMNYFNPETGQWIHNRIDLNVLNEIENDVERLETELNLFK